MLDIMETLENWFQPLKDFIVENHGNPFLWVGLFILGLIIFSATYSALSKEK